MNGSLALVTTSADATRDLAAAVAARCVPGDVLLLCGDLGAGKTTFAQGFGRALGIVEPVTSPTFVLVHQYDVAGDDAEGGHKGVRTLYHADVYRLDHMGEIADLGLGQLVEDGGVALVEWGDAARPVLGNGALTVELAAGPEEHVRTITVGSDGPAWTTRWTELASALAPWRNAA